MGCRTRKQPHDAERTLLHLHETQGNGLFQWIHQLNVSQILSLCLALLAAGFTGFAVCVLTVQPKCLLNNLLCGCGYYYGNGHIRVGFFFWLFSHLLAALCVGW